MIAVLEHGSLQGVRESKPSQSRVCVSSQIQPDLAASFVEKTKLLAWLLRRLKRRDFDTNKQYASEVLAVLMQVSGRTAPARQRREGTQRKAW